MSKAIWSKFFWTDWMSDAGVRRSSVAARGLWMDMLCLAAQHTPIGYVAINGEGLSEEELARIAGVDPTSVQPLILELERNGVFSRNRDGIIYSRRMVNDSKRRAALVKNLPPCKQKENSSLGPNDLASGSGSSGSKREEEFQCFWDKYPHRVGKGAARRAFEKVNVSLDSLLRALDEYIRTKPKDRPWCNPATWLNQERWEDRPAESAQEDDTARFRRMLEHEHKTGEWPWKTLKSEIPSPILAEFESKVAA
jgi:hypothetical protein